MSFLEILTLIVALWAGHLLRQWINEIYDEMENEP
jgi:hypothetical protein